MQIWHFSSFTAAFAVAHQGASTSKSNKSVGPKLSWGLHFHSVCRRGACGNAVLDAGMLVSPNYWEQAVNNGQERRWLNFRRTITAVCSQQTLEEMKETSRTWLTGDGCFTCCLYKLNRGSASKLSVPFLSIVRSVFLVIYASLHLLGGRIAAKHTQGNYLVFQGARAQADDFS